MYCRFIHTQEFIGKVITGGFNKTVADEREIQETIDAIYSDPHVVSVQYEVIEGGNGNDY